MFTVLDYSDDPRSGTFPRNMPQQISTSGAEMSLVGQARRVRDRLPAKGLFTGHEWRVSPAPLPLGPALAEQIESLGRILLQFYRAANLLYRKSAEGKLAPWVASWLDRGKPARLVQTQRAATFKSDLPRVIRPDLLLLDDHFVATELDSVPGGIGLTAWLNRAYSELGHTVLGGAGGMADGFASIFGDASRVRIIVSEEASTYRPEMEWIAAAIDSSRFTVHGGDFAGIRQGDAVYRFFELFDLENVPNSAALLELATAKQIRLTPPPKAFLEEKMLLALLWNRNLHSFWRQELGESFFRRLLKVVPYTWVVDPSPLPPHGAIPELNLTDWRQLGMLSQKERDLILKVSGFSPHAWGARGVYLGSDLPHSEWAAAVETAIRGFGTSPFVLQRYNRPRLVDATWVDFAKDQPVPMKGRTRLCPYYFVAGEGDSARAKLGGVLATVCPADKKIIHGMTDAIFAPCCI